MVKNLVTDRDLMFWVWGNRRSMNPGSLSSSHVKVDGQRDHTP